MNRYVNAARDFSSCSLLMRQINICIRTYRKGRILCKKACRIEWKWNQKFQFFSDIDNFTFSRTSYFFHAFFNGILRLHRRTNTSIVLTGLKIVSPLDTQNFFCSFSFPYKIVFYLVEIMNYHFIFIIICHFFVTITILNNTIIIHKVRTVPVRHCIETMLFDPK